MNLKKNVDSATRAVIIHMIFIAALIFSPLKIAMLFHVMYTIVTYYTLEQLKGTDTTKN